MDKNLDRHHRHNLGRHCAIDSGGHGAGQRGLELGLILPRPPQQFAAALHPRQRLLYFNAGFATQSWLRAILRAAGYDLAFGPLARRRAEDAVVVWGKSPTAYRGEAFAARHGLNVFRIEDAFVRSIGLGRQGDAAMGLLIDPIGVHFNAGAPSLLEQMLASAPLDAPALLARAAAGMARLRDLDISKYNLHDPRLAAPVSGYVLVIDQTKGDASIAHAGADADRFSQMLQAARREHPRAPILIKTHPETAHGLRAGHFGAQDCDARTQITTAALSPWTLLQGASAVYTVSSQMGLEAILAGHRPQVFGAPFYAGWGLSDDRMPIARRGRRLSAAQLFAASHLLAPTWYDPFSQQICPFEVVLDILEARLRARREDHAGYVAYGMRAWKRPHIQAMFGTEKPVIFQQNAQKAAAIARAKGARLMIWGAGEQDAAPPADLRVEDGLLRSAGLGAALTPPLSLVLDDLGIYYDPHRPSRFEALMTQPLPEYARARAQALVDGLCAAGLSKYNLAQKQVTLPDTAGRVRVLVPGQVEDDASIRLGAGLNAAGALRGNLDLLHAARAAHPGGFIIYKPHPDVEAGLRRGAVDLSQHAGLADFVAARADAASLLAQVDMVFTLTSTYGFEALLRGVKVCCLGTPFYAGWGLTQDLGEIPARRAAFVRARAAQGQAVLDLVHLAHAALIAYPRYFDPLTRQPCPPEVALMRLTQARGVSPLPRSFGLRLLAKIQGQFASYAHWWR